MKHKNIFIRNIILIIALFVCGAFSAPNVVLVSPYVVRGFSKTYAASFHPETFTGRYEITTGIYGHEIGGIDSVTSVMFMETERFNTFGITDNVGIGFSLFGLPFEWFFLRARFITVVNIYNKGANDLFANIAISPFLGISISSVLPGVMTIEYQTHTHPLFYNYFHNYCGISVGTRNLIQGIYSFELFASPSYSVTNNLSDFEVEYNITGRIDFLTQSLNIPVGFRYISEKRMVKFSIKSGVGLHFIFNEERTNTDYDWGDEPVIRSSYSFKSSYLSAFAEMGFHFGTKRYNVERRKLLNLEKGK
jgi:hypothetical protein